MIDMSHRVYDETNTLRKFWNDADRTFTEWDERGVEVTRRDYNDKEIAAADKEAVFVSISNNRTVISDALRAHMASLDAITASSGSLTLAQLSNAVRVLARGQKRLIRLEIGELASTD